MKQLPTIAIIAAVAFLAIGGLVVIITRGLGQLTPNALLRLTDTSLLFAITLLLLNIAGEKK